MAFNRAGKLKAETPRLRQNLIHGLVQERRIPLDYAIPADDSRSTPYHQAHNGDDGAATDTWLKDAALLDATKKRLQYSCTLLIDTLSEYSECLKTGRTRRLRWTSTRLPSGSDGQVHTDVTILASFLRTVGGCAPTEHKYAAVHINRGTAAASIAIPHATSALGGALIAPPAHCSDQV
ncbi:hypothetical protein EDB92DRAFT_1942889 [Lactarius akahatsu]|uniref:Uncharacterized protein n=1 Tax=Lactarius akahatsu TaxID=416441 RepID=A0AAD4LPA5_9AGAM|nr:hypothetical protein EDB92DRAFT_1942889 [Lactarius akahatsu]